VTRLYLRVYAALLAVVVAFFASASVLFWQRGGGPEDDVAAAGAALVGLMLPSADAPRDAQQAAVERIAAAVGSGVALFDADGRRIAEAGGFVPLPRFADGRSHPLHASRGRRGVALRLADGRWLAVHALGPPHRHGAFFASLALLAVLIGVAAYPLARSLARRIERLTARVDAFGAGDLAVRADVAGRDEVARLAASFNQAAARIEALVATQRTLLASASHALRSPLARLRVAAELLADGGAPERVPELRRELAREVAALDAAVAELLAVSRLELGSAEHAPVDVLALAAEEGARAGAEVTGTPAGVAGDARSLRHLLRNLLENARRHADGAPLVAVAALDPARPDAGARVEVADRGPGVPEAERERIFEPFAKGTAAPESGVGLGLAIVRQIARHHGGEARVRARDGGGSVFEVTLPGRPKGAA
jgi:signal transduction histidine kinase